MYARSLRLTRGKNSLFLFFFLKNSREYGSDLVTASDSDR